MRIAECRKVSRGNLRKIKWGTFRIPQVKNFAVPWIAAKLPFARIVQQMCNRCVEASDVQHCLPSVFFMVHLPLNRVVFLQFLNFRVSSTFQLSHYFAGQCDWLQFVHCVSKNIPPLTRYNLYVHSSIARIFGINVAENVGNQNILYFPTSSNYCFCTTWGNRKPGNCVFLLKCCMLFHQKT